MEYIEIVAQGPNWRIEYDAQTNDYAAIITLDSGDDYIGSCALLSQARNRISQYLYPDPR